MAVDSGVAVAVGGAVGRSVAVSVAVGNTVGVAVGGNVGVGVGTTVATSVAVKVAGSVAVGISAPVAVGARATSTVDVIPLALFTALVSVFVGARATTEVVLSVTDRTAGADNTGVSAPVARIGAVSLTATASGVVVCNSMPNISVGVLAAPGVSASPRLINWVIASGTGVDRSTLGVGSAIARVGIAVTASSVCLGSWNSAGR